MSGRRRVVVLAIALVAVWAVVAAAVFWAATMGI